MSFASFRTKTTSFEKIPDVYETSKESGHLNSALKFLPLVDNVLIFKGGFLKTFIVSKTEQQCGTFFPEN